MIKGEIKAICFDYLQLIKIEHKNSKIFLDSHIPQRMLLNELFSKRPLDKILIRADHLLEIFQFLYRPTNATSKRT